MITVVTVYRTMGQQFERFEDAVEHREGLVEKFFRETPGFYDVPLRLRTAFIESVLGRRQELIKLLSYDDNIEEE